jgi:hypothetical protein
LFFFFFLRRGKNRGNERSRKVHNMTEDWDLRGKSSLFHYLICKRFSPSFKVYPILVIWHMDYGYFFR